MQYSESGMKYLLKKEKLKNGRSARLAPTVWGFCAFASKTQSDFGNVGLGSCGNPPLR